ncbi:SocA family protein [Patescibacteria group bacterium]|nr:SocA family protein [Patescibacteria group bacterium]MBU1885172.1 SocA family protein [Patescibacteria group bacterium]
MKIPLVKLKAILLYFCNHTDVKFLGKVKLMKLFYFLDFIHLKTYGSPVTYDTYINLEHGPIPSFIKNLIDNAADDLNESELSDVIDIDKPDGISMCRFLPKRKFLDDDKKHLSEVELEILEKICLRFGDKNTKYLEDISHKESAWRMTRFLQVIPYNLAANDKDCLVEEEDIKLLMDIM